jgi:hypothetical protein
MRFIERILYSAIGVLVAYFIISRWTGKRVNDFNSKFFYYSLVLLIVTVGFGLLVNWTSSEPEIITQTVEQLKVDPEIKRKIGSFKGYGYNQNEIKSIKELPANIDFTLFGSDAEIHLSVLVDSSANIFEVKEYKVEDLAKE